FVVDVRRKAKPVAKPAIDDVPGTPVGRFQIVAVQVVSQRAHAPGRRRDLGGSGRTLDDAPVSCTGQYVARVTAAVGANAPRQGAKRLPALPPSGRLLGLQPATAGS